MDERIHDLVADLRRAGVHVSLAETLDACRALPLVPWSNPAVFRTALAATLIKRSRDLPAFDRLFPLHFGLGASALPATALEISPALAAEWQRFDLQHDAGPLAGFLVMGGGAHAGGGAGMSALLRRAAQEAGLAELAYAYQAGAYVRRILARLGWQEARALVALFLQEMAEAGLPDRESERAREAVEANARALLEAVQEMVREQVELQAAARAARIDEERVLETPFSSLSREEMLGMRRAVDRLALRLRDRLGRRPRPAHRGTLDLKAVVRRNLRYDGLPLEPAWRKPRRDKPDIISLCDISSSVWHASRFMLQFLYTVQERCRRVRSFVFVADLEEVTELFARFDIDLALEKAMNRGAYERSDYGSVLAQFCAQHLESVDSRTTILVIGDGRSNRLPPRLDAFQALAERARRVVWLNPEPAGLWGAGDSIMPLYVPLCAAAVVCGNLRQLNAAVEGLLLTER